MNSNGAVSIFLVIHPLGELRFHNIIFLNF